MPTSLVFDPFCLDVTNQRLLRGEAEVPLTPKAFDLLRFLAQNAGRLLTKKELLDTLWSDVIVGDAVLKTCVLELRKALGDDVKTPRFIETVHRRGYRFVAVTGVRDASSTKSSLARRVVGREAEIASLQRWFGKARQGQRQIVFLTGEAGIGKTTVVESFLASLTGAPMLTAHGQCVAQYGAGEAYLPVLEAFGRLCREPGMERLTALLRHRAPTWLMQMPWLLGALDREHLERELLGATRERMLREMAELVEAMTTEATLVLVLEDLHWSDYATLDLVSLLARRREPARLLLLGTYRPVELVVSDHPFRAHKQELLLHKRCEELVLEPLREEAIADYLKLSFEGASPQPHLARAVHRRTDGNPLFMVNVVDSFEARGVVRRVEGKWVLEAPAEDAELGIPESLRQMIEEQIARLTSEDRRLLEAASAAGQVFAAAEVGAALEEDPVQVEERCEELARRGQFLLGAGSIDWPDGTLSARYAFTHALYQNVFYQRLPAGFQKRCHARIAERKEAAYGTRSNEVAASLAAHYEGARDFLRAVRHWRSAAENDARKYASPEAVQCLRRTLELVAKLPPLEQIPARLEVLERLGLLYRSMGSVLEAAEQFRALAREARVEGRLETEVRALFYVASALSWFDRDRCLAAIGEAVERSRGLEDALLQTQARGSAGYWRLLWNGWDTVDAQACEEAVQAARGAGNDVLLVQNLGRLSYFQSLRSEYRLAAVTAEEGVRLARAVGDNAEHLLCNFYLGWAFLHAGRWEELKRLLAEALETAQRNGHHRWVVLFRLEKAWLHLEALEVETARDLCLEANQRAQELRSPYGQLMASVLLGLSYLSLGDLEEAGKVLRSTRERLEGERVLMDWIWKMPLYLGVSEHALRTGDLVVAKTAATQACVLAETSQECTYLALARRALARVALAGKNKKEAEKQIALAQKTLADADAPLASWRVQETAAQVKGFSASKRTNAGMNRGFGSGTGASFT